MIDNLSFPIVCIIGPTASGKTKLAVQLANDWDAEIISVDSRQVYKRMDIGTGKDLAAYVIGGRKIRVHLIDIIEPSERYHLQQFQLDFWKAVVEINTRKKKIIVCGGTGLYLESVINNFEYTAIPVNSDLRIELAFLTKEELTLRFENGKNLFPKNPDLSTKKRIIRAIEIKQYLSANELIEIEKPKADFLVFALSLPVKERNLRIDARLLERLNNGLLEEVKKLLKEGISEEQLLYFGLEYKYVTQYLQGDFTLQEMHERLKIKIHQYAKRQMTFFRKMEKSNIPIHWLKGENTIDHNCEIIKDSVASEH